MDKTTSDKHDLTQGGILDKLIMIALPIIGTQLIMMSYNLVDMFLLGRVGSDAVAASGTAGMYLWLSNGVMLIGRMGAEIGVAQSRGRGDMEAARRFFENALFLAVVCGLLFALICFLFSRQLIGFFNIREAGVARDARLYLLVTALWVPFSFVNAAVAGAFNGFGNSRVPFLINAVGLLLNMLLDPLFIFTFKMGVLGAAVATTLAGSVASVLSLLALTRRADRPFECVSFRNRPELVRIRQILRWSVPICLESMLFTFFVMFLSRFVAAYGADAIAVYRVATNIESLSWLICMGFSTALTAFVGQNYGAGKWERIAACNTIAFRAMLIWGVVVTAVMLGAGRFLFSLFLPDPALIETGRTFLMILAICQIPGCLEAAGSGAFRGLGRTLPPSVSSSVSNGLRVPLAYVLSLFTGLDGIWWGITIGASARGMWTYLWYLKEVRGRR